MWRLFWKLSANTTKATCVPPSAKRIRVRHQAQPSTHNPRHAIRRRRADLRKQSQIPFLRRANWLQAGEYEGDRLLAKAMAGGPPKARKYQAGKAAYFANALSRIRTATARQGQSVPPLPLARRNCM